MASTAQNEEEPEPQPDMSLSDITDGENERKIPLVKFPEDVAAFANSFTPPASAELLIGAYTELHNKFKSLEANLEQKSKVLTRLVSWLSLGPLRFSRSLTLPHFLP